jgi:two-component system, OmpR family, alkaline phosphatase synthesis response regulator PhoP
VAARALILVVDDEEPIRQLASLYLEKEGFQVACASDGPEAIEMAQRQRPALVVLDVMLPTIDGFEVCRRLRQGSDVPILMLTARNEDVDKIVGLELGADDYLTKPFNPREMVARVKAILRRYESGQRAGPTLRLGPLTVDKQRREARAGDKELSLRTKEFELLVAFLENAGIVLGREQLLDLVWGYEFYGETRTVDVHVQHLRQKLAGSGVGIQTVRGVGYKLVEETASAAEEAT